MIELAHNPMQEWRTESFDVDCRAYSKGSLRAVPNGRGGTYMKESAGEKLAVFMGTIRAQARAIWAEPCTGPVMLALTFRFTKPEKTKYPDYPASSPDIDKLCRGVLDAMTKFAYVDDGQVVSLTAMKMWTHAEPNVSITVSWLEPKTLFTAESSNGTKEKRRQPRRFPRTERVV